MKKVITLFLFFFIFSNYLNAQTAGYEDCSFGDGGYVQTDFDANWDSPKSAAIYQSGTHRGKIVVAGDSENAAGTITMASVARYNTDGTLDNTFSGDGKLTIDVPSTTYDRGQGVALQTDDKIIITGNSNTGIFVIRVNADGTLDNTFSGDGIATFGSGYAGKPFVQSDGKILVPAYDGTNSMVLRINTNGTEDVRYSVDMRSGCCEGLSGVMQASDGTIYATGYANDGTRNTMSIISFNSTLTGLNTSFDGDGKKFVYFNNEGGSGASVIEDASNKILVTGYATYSGQRDYVVASLNTDGSFNTSFGGGDGKANADIGGEQTGYAELTSDGKIIIGSYTSGMVSAACFNSDGTLNTNFGDNGLFSGFGFDYNYGYQLAIGPDDEIILVVQTGVGGDDFRDYGIVKLVGFNKDQEYCCSNVTQNTNIAGLDSEEEMLKIEICAPGDQSPYNVTGITCNTNGTTNTSDISNAKLYFTGLSGAFNTSNQYGSTVVNPDGTFTFTGSQQLGGGTNYFWLTFTTPSNATLGNVLDAECTTVTLDGGLGDQIPSTTAPLGSRTLSNVIYSEDFAGCALPTGWTIIDNDGDGFNWIAEDVPFASESTGRTGCGMASESYTNDFLTPDNWLISPAIDLSEATEADISYWIAGLDDLYPNERMRCYVSTSGSTVADFTGASGAMINDYTTVDKSWVERTASLDPYVGNTIYLAWRHNEVGANNWAIRLDDILLTGIIQSCTEPDVPAVTATVTSGCSGLNSTLNISGNLNDATAWHVYTGSCGGTSLGSTATSSFAVSPSSTTTYYVRGEGGCATPATCGTVTITTTPATTISAQPEANTEVCEGSSDITLSVTGTGTGTVTYQWYNSSGLIADETASSLTIATNPSNSDTYYCMVGSDCGNVQSDAAVVLIKSNTTGTDVQTACESYTWIDGNTYTASNNTATHTLTNAAGCDSVVTLNLTINSSTTGTDIQTACDSYTWIDGNTYTAGNSSATHTLTNAAGCDSVVTLNLTINSSTTGTDIQTACDSYTWIDGNTYTASNSTATHTLTNAAGCDSVVTLNLIINSSTTGTDIQTACDSYTWIDGNTYTASNSTATHTLTNAAGCDSVVTLNLTIKNSTTGTDIQTACDSYTWIDGNTYTASNNTATHTLTNAAGCDSVVTLNLNINNSTTGTDVQTACDSYTWIDGNTYTESNNTATHTLTNATGCDSVVTLDLTINKSTAGTDVQSACLSFTWIDGITYTESNNTATHTLSNAAGCDSVVTLDLTMLNSVTGADVQTACDSYTWIDGNTYTESNTAATHTLTSVNGCDSVVTLNLTINNSTVGTDIQTACDSYTWIDGITYTESNNIVTHTLTNAAGCDSVVTLDLTIIKSTAGDTIAVACDSFEWYGTVYTESGTATHVFENAAGCDSVVTLQLTILPSTAGTDVQVACNSYEWIDGITYTESNNSAMYTIPNSAGCDSVITLDLTILESTQGSDVQVACDSYTWIDGITYTESNNTATHTLINAAGCDSIVTLDLTIIKSTAGDTVAVACDSFEWYGTVYTESGTATHIFENATGCDSVVTLDLTILPSTAGTDVQVACESYEWIDGNTYTSSNNTVTYTLTNAAGCDSVVTLNLTINESYSTTDVAEICEGDTYEFGTQVLSISGEYSETFTSATSCDSTVTLTLNVIPSVRIAVQPQAEIYACTGGNGITISLEVEGSGTPSYQWYKDGSSLRRENRSSVSIPSNEANSGTYYCVVGGGCNGDIISEGSVVVINSSFSSLETVASCGSYTWPANNIEYTQGGEYSTTLQSSYGCDSIITLQLTVNMPYEVAETATICEGESYILGSQTLTDAGEYSETFTSAEGCDSIVTLNLTVNMPYEVSESAAICEGESYTLGSQVITATGEYSETFTSAEGCDSVVMVAITVLPTYTVTNEVTVAFGESYTFGTQTLTESGEYTESFSTVDACDSTVTLTFTVLAEGEKITNLSEAACGSYEFAGMALTETGMYYDTLQTTTGADSIVVIDLTINPVYNETAVLTIGSGESYTFGSQTLTETGEYTEVFASAEGCDSTVVLSLTVLEEGVTITELAETACGAYAFAGETVTESGTYRDTLQSASGADSILVLSLTVNPEYSVADEVIVAYGESYAFGTQTLTESGEYTEVFTTELGCDSTVMLTFQVLALGETVTELTETACGSYAFAGQDITESGVYKDTLTSVGGADSILILNLTVNPTYAETITETILEGESFMFGMSTYTETGEYVETFSSLSGCDSLVTLYLLVDGAPHIIQIPAQTIGGGLTSTTIDLSEFISDETALDDITWTVTGGSKIAIAIANGIATISVLDVNWSGSETLTITATDGNGQSASSNVTITYEAEIGIPLVNAKAEISIYPNPSGGVFFVEASGDSKFSVVVSTMAGAEVYEGTANGNLKVNLNTVPNGVYTVTVTNGEKTETLLLSIE